jgi:4-methyl-5(b-hydroxyethyl)-thiazole monophosphate biosynthesis
MRAVVLLDNGYEELEAMGPIALLRRGGVDVDVVRVQPEDVTGRFGIMYTPTIYMKIYDFAQADCLILPGGPQHLTLRTIPDVLKLIHVFADTKKICAICASPTILGQEGLLKGRKYTCFTSLNEDFGGEYVDAYAVTDGNMVTGRSAAASIEFAFAVLELLCGKEHTDKVKASVYYQ